MPVADRVKALINQANQTQKKFAEGLGISPPRLNNYLSGIRDIPQDLIVRIAEFTGCELSWLLTGKEPMYHNNVPARARSSSFIQIPVVADIAAGTGIEAFDVEPEERITVHKSLLSVPGPYYAFSVSGESMAPYITTNDLAIVTQTWHDLDIQDRILAFRTHNGLTLKRFHIEKKRKLSLLIPLNPTYPILKYTEDDPEYTVLGLLLLIIRRF